MNPPECPECGKPLDDKRLPCYVCKRSNCKMCDACCNDDDQRDRPTKGKTR